MMRKTTLVTQQPLFRPYSVAFVAALALGLAGCGGYQTSSQPQVSDRGATASGIDFQFKTLPAVPTAGIPVIWDLKVLDLATTKGLKSFEDKNGQRLRLAVVSQDNQQFQLIQPDYKDYGHFVTQSAFPVAGTYRAFAFFTPFGGKPLAKRALFAPFKEKLPDGETRPIKKYEIGVKSAPELQPMPQKLPLVPDKVVDGRIEKTAKGLRVVLQIAAPRARQTTNLTLITRDAAGAPSRDLEPVLGAPAQMVAVSQDQQSALAPVLLEGTGVRGAACVFPVVFPSAGLYTIWTQFARGGETISVPFVVRVAPEEMRVAPEEKG